MAEEDLNEEVLEEEEEDLTPPKKDKPKKCPECPSMAPAWMATFADMATLLMAFFVLILSFTESDKPSINKIVSGSRADSMGVQREVPSVEPPTAENMIAKNFKTAKVQPSFIVNVEEETTDSDPQDIELKSTDDPADKDNNSDLQTLKQALKKEIAKGKVEVTSEDGKILVNVKEDQTDLNESEREDDRTKGQIDQETLDLYAKIAETQSYLSAEVEVSFDSGNSEEERLKEQEKDERIDDQLRKVKADLNSAINQGLANVERVGDQILIQLSSQGSFRSGFSELRTDFLPTLAQVAQTLDGSDASITVSGHTDNIPIAFSERFESNWDLSAARASAVADYFMDAGRVTEERISVLGFADTKPIASNDNPTGRAQNRRIEILVDN
ncbi:OmpA family protein [Pseudomonadales bacterium]|jgi:chemotaxis protein MotB|nr:OmpA family protein [Pseudomonadales bacterium]